MAAGDGLVTMTPTSVDHSGTSASINADGSVDFSAVTSLSLNGVFTSGFDNYLIVFRGTVSANESLRFKLRAAGTDTTGTNYVRQYLQASGSSAPNGARSAAQDNAIWGEGFAQQRIGCHWHVYGPALAQPTAVRVVSAMDELSASIIDSAVTHSLSTSYDGITLYVVADNFTGSVVVFGYEE